MNLNVKFMISDIPTVLGAPAGDTGTYLCITVFCNLAGSAIWSLYPEKDSGAEAAGDRT